MPDSSLTVVLGEPDGVELNILIFKLSMISNLGLRDLSKAMVRQYYHIPTLRLHLRYEAFSAAFSVL